MPAPKVLVLGDDTRGFLAVVRSLGRRNIAVHAAPANFRSPALRSRYISVVHDLPPWIGDGRDWLAAASALLQTERFDLVIPCNETTLLPLQRHRDQLSRFATLAIPDDRSISVLFDKHATRELARQMGVPVAAGRLARAEEDAAAVFETFGSPVVLKPRRSFSLDALAARGAVHVVDDRHRLARLLAACDPEETVIEEFFTGQGAGVSVLASRGRIIQAFEHHRVREIAGASFYRISAALKPDLVGACASIVGALQYTGVAMFEFKLAADGGWILLEVNARPWGSLPLPIALGVDFPYRWYRLLTAGEETPPVDYRIGVYGRNLIPDLQNSRIEAEARHLGVLAKLVFLAGRIAEMGRMFTGREVGDVLVRDDPRPGLVELRQFGGEIWRRCIGRLPGAPARRRNWARAAAAAAVRQSRGAARIVFVCQGNICRSPFAAALLRARMGKAAFIIHSAGMMPQQGRQTPLFGVAAAAAYEIDLAPHRSVWFDRTAADAASLVIVFDAISENAVLNRYPRLRPRTIRLGDPARLGDIRDPVDGGPAEFAAAYRLIAAAIDELELIIASGSRS